MNEITPENSVVESFQFAGDATLPVDYGAKDVEEKHLDAGKRMRAVCGRHPEREEEVVNDREHCVSGVVMIKHKRNVIVRNAPREMAIAPTYSSI